jgi:hypothetical protein
MADQGALRRRPARRLPTASSSQDMESGFLDYARHSTPRRTGRAVLVSMLRRGPNARHRCAARAFGGFTNMAPSFTPFGIVLGWLQRRPGRPAYEPGSPQDEPGLTRRGLFAGAAAAGVAGALSAATPSASAASRATRRPPGKRHLFDVIVVGAGLAGLTAAAGRGMTVVEPRNSQTLAVLLRSLSPTAAVLLRSRSPRAPGIRANSTRQRQHSCDFAPYSQGHRF